MNPWKSERWQRNIPADALGHGNRVFVFADHGVNAEVKRACREFVEWLKGQYVFPLPLRVYLRDPGNAANDGWRPRLRHVFRAGELCRLLLCSRRRRRLCRPRGLHRAGQRLGHAPVRRRPRTDALLSVVQTARPSKIAGGNGRRSAARAISCAPTPARARIPERVPRLFLHQIPRRQRFAQGGAFFRPPEASEAGAVPLRSCPSSQAPLSREWG